MKNLLLLLTILITFSLPAQEGVITYQHRIDRSTFLPIDRMELKGPVPDFSQTEKLLFFTDTASLYVPVKTEDEVIQHDRGSMTFQTAKTEIRKLKALGISQTLSNYKGTVYLILDSVKAPDWKFTQETKNILGHTCSKAYYTYESELTLFKNPSQRSPAKIDKIKRTQEVVVWYTDNLPSSLGPDRYHTLPGLVLEVSINNGEQSLLATDIQLREVSPDELMFSRGGIPVTRDAYRKIVADRIAQH
jgi:GLPGLI family protein